MATKKPNKIVYDGTTLIDLTADTVEASSLLSGVTAHDKSGETITGTCTYDADTSADTASASEILTGQTAHVAGAKVTGSMANNGGITKTISAVAEEAIIPVGYHDGSGKVSIASAEQSKIIASNIKSGVEILGVTGTYAGEIASLQAKEATPSSSQQVITYDSTYDGLSQVTVKAVPYSTSENASGGLTVTIL